VQERFDELLTANGSALLRLASSYTNTPSDRDDLFQEIALAIWKALPRFRGESSERTFIFRIAHNRAMSYIARRRLHGSPAEEIDLPDPRPSPEADLLQEQRQARLLAVIHDLPVEYKQVITLMLEGMTYAEIAEVVGISENNVGVRLTRAREMLRRSLEVEK
jgi:RNA polymerase sigma factor (sigma-70 family)